MSAAPTSLLHCRYPSGKPSAAWVLHLLHCYSAGISRVSPPLQPPTVTLQVSLAWAPCSLWRSTSIFWTICTSTRSDRSPSLNRKRRTERTPRCRSTSSQRLASFLFLKLCYRPQQSCGKVMFSQACVKNSVHRGVSVLACTTGHMTRGDSVRKVSVWDSLSRGSVYVKQNPPPIDRGPPPVTQ